MMGLAMVTLTAVLATCTSGREIAMASQGQSRKAASKQMVFNEGPTKSFKVQDGIASWYHEGAGIKTAAGERYEPDGITAAHPTLPMGTIVKVTRTDTGKSITLRINDRGPYKNGRIIDLSRGAARKMDMFGVGISPCRVEVVQYPKG